jgi:hypothetical protein
MVSVFLAVLAALLVVRQVDAGHPAAAALWTLGVLAVCGVVDLVVLAVRKLRGGTAPPARKA